MTHKVTQVGEWEEEYCYTCGHPVSSHYDTPQEVVSPITGLYTYTAEDCMVLAGKRRLEGNNPYLRCECLYSN